MISLIIPIGPQETHWKPLVDTALRMKFPGEIICVACESSLAFQAYQDQVTWIFSQTGRGRQLNAGAKKAKGEVLWFVHADSEISLKHWEELKQCHETGGLYYFDLKFKNDGPALVKVNQWAANLRSQVLSLPFGDQGFALSKNLFFHLGGFDEEVSYGEDHLFVWKVKESGLPLTRIPLSLVTSARKYQKGGWLKTSLNHWALTLEQGLPAYGKYIRRKFSNKRTQFPEQKDL